MSILPEMSFSSALGMQDVVKGGRDEVGGGDENHRLHEAARFKHSIEHLFPRLRSKRNTQDFCSLQQETKLDQTLILELFAQQHRTFERKPENR